MQSETYNAVWFDPPLEAYGGFDSLPAILSRMARDGELRCIGVDGYLGTNWEAVRERFRWAIGSLPGLKRNLRSFATSDYMKSAEDLKRLYGPYLENGDPVFGRLFRGDILHLFRPHGLSALRAELLAALNEGLPVVLCCGEGALCAPLSNLYDVSFYFDATRERVYRQSKEKAADLIGYLSDKHTYYIGFPTRDRHRASVLERADYYVDNSDSDRPVFLSRSALGRLLDRLSSLPFRVKPLYYPGVWGGQWMIQQRGLAGMRNCAYAFELIAPEQSIVLRLEDGTRVELPFALLHDLRMKNIMSNRTKRRFGGEFPIRFAYDDTWRGGNLSIQVHPTRRYMKRTFGENMCQAETYYILDAKPGSIVHLGLTEEAEVEEFRRAAAESEQEGRPIDHLRFVQQHSARKGDLFLIPPGTVHGAGADEIVLEISSTPYRYTFKIYDYRRPDLDGTFRPLSVAHAFNVLNPARRGKWVRENLIASPRLLKEKDGAREFVLLDRPEFPHRIHTVEFSASYEDRTGACFHLLNLIEGEMVGVTSSGSNQAVRKMAFSETLLIPRAVGRYRVVNLGARPCVVIKSFVR